MLAFHRCAGRLDQVTTTARTFCEAKVAVRIGLRQLSEKVTRGQDATLRVVFAGGTVFSNRDGGPKITIVFHTRAAELPTVLLGYVGLFEGYFDGAVDIIGEPRPQRTGPAADLGIAGRPRPACRRR